METNPDINKIGQLSNLDGWQLRVLDSRRILDTEKMRQQHVADAFEARGKMRLTWGVLGALAGASVGYFAHEGSILAPAMFGLVTAFLAMLLAHQLVRSGGNDDAREGLMSQVAGQSGAVWHEDMAQQVPNGNPLMRMSFHTGSHQAELGMAGFDRMVAPRVGAFADVDDANHFDKRGDSAYEERVGEGVVGRLPGHDLQYGVFNFTITERRRVGNKGRGGESRANVDGSMHSNTHSEEQRYEYVIAWLDLQIPFPSLELRRRLNKDGNAVEMMMDRLDTKFSDQRVLLDLGDEEFDRHFKVEMPVPSEEAEIRRMFSPKIMNQLACGDILVPESIIYRNGRMWIIDGRLEKFDGPSAAKTIDYMLYRAKLATHACKLLAAEVGKDIRPPI